MVDLISRQKALEELKEAPFVLFWEHGMEEDELVDTIERQMRGCVERMLEWLPSIDNEIVRCGDCKHWDREGHNCNIRDSYGWDYKVDDYCSYGESEDE